MCGYPLHKGPPLDSLPWIEVNTPVRYLDLGFINLPTPTHFCLLIGQNVYLVPRPSIPRPSTAQVCSPLMPTTPGERGKRPMAYSARILDSCHSCSTVNYFRHRFPAASINFLRVPNYCLFVHLCLDGGDRQIWTRWGREFGHLSPWRSESPSAVSLSRWSRLCRSTNIELIDLCPEIRSDAQVSTDGTASRTPFWTLGSGSHLEAN